MPKIQTQDSWSTDCSPERLLPLSPPSVYPEELTFKPQTGWLVFGALWLYYIVNFGTLLTAFPWLFETLKYTYYIDTISRLQSGESDTPSGRVSIFLHLNGYCEGNIGPLFLPVITLCHFHFFGLKIAVCSLAWKWAITKSTLPFPPAPFH